MKICEGSVKTWKHSLRLDLAVMVGSKVVSSPALIIAPKFFSHQRCVRVRLSLGHLVETLNFGFRLVTIVLAFTAHLCGFLHPFWRSFMQGGQGQEGVGWCSCSRRVSRLVSLTHFLTFLTPWTICRQASCVL